MVQLPVALSHNSHWGFVPGPYNKTPYTWCTTFKNAPPRLLSATNNLQTGYYIWIHKWLEILSSQKYSRTTDLIISVCEWGIPLAHITAQHAINNQSMRDEMPIHTSTRFGTATTSCSRKLSNVFISTAVCSICSCISCSCFCNVWDLDWHSEQTDGACHQQQ